MYPSIKTMYSALLPKLMIDRLVSYHQPSKRTQSGNRAQWGNGNDNRECGMKLGIGQEHKRAKKSGRTSGQ